MGTTDNRVRIGLYGTNGHQVLKAMVNNPKARLVAVAGITREQLPEPLAQDSSVHVCDDLAHLLANPDVELVSLCSPRRADQAADAIAALDAGKHVYAEKPAALTESDLDDILLAARRNGRRFHEMAVTAFEHPYLAMRTLVQAGTIGTVVQAWAQKSYPYHQDRPQDENVDGGLIGQNAIHAVRFIEHVGGVPVARVWATETSLGNPVTGGGLRMASTLMMTLENGGLATAVANYFNPRGFGHWGNEELRIWGTKGMIESVDSGTRTRLVVGQEDRGAVPTGPSLDYLALFLDEIRGHGAMPVSLEEELHPLRVVIRANQSAKTTK
jgi:predicted dehydrogenase